MRRGTHSCALNEGNCQHGAGAAALQWGDAAPCATGLQKLSVLPPFSFLRLMKQRVDKQLGNIAVKAQAEERQKSSSAELNRCGGLR